MLTEKEAWLKIAEHFNKEHNWNRKLVTEDKVYRGDGICICIDILERNYLIDKETGISMELKLRDLPRIESGRGRSYVWQLDEEGDKERVKFCLEQAEKL